MVSPQFSLSPEVAIISMTFSRNLPKEHADVRVYCYIGTHNDTISSRLLTIFRLSLICQKSTLLDLHDDGFAYFYRDD